MSLVKKHIERLKVFSQNIDKIAEKQVVNNAGEIINMLRYEQLAKGINSNENPISNGSSHKGFYSKNTHKKAYEQGLAIPKSAGLPYNFQWTGDTFSSMGLKPIPSQKGFNIFTIDGKMNKLRSFYDHGGDIFKLTDKNNKKVNDEIIMPELFNELMDELTNF